MASSHRGIFKVGEQLIYFYAFISISRKLHEQTTKAMLILKFEGSIFISFKVTLK